MKGMMHPLLAAMQSGRVLLMDGAMGTELQRMGLRPPARPDDWNLHQPNRIRAVHQRYAKSGAEVLLTNTFQTNPIALSERLRNQPQFLAQSFRSAVEQASQFARRDRFIVIAIGPSVSGRNVEFQDLAALDRVLNLAQEAAAADGILFETISSARIRYAVQRAKRMGRPVLLSLTYRRDGNGRFTTFDGHSPEWFAERAEKWGFDALGVNCGLEISVEDSAAIVRQYRNETDLPLFARPNAGTPIKKGERWIYPRLPAKMAAEMPRILEAGATMIGGCCGTTPAHIRAFRRVVDEWNSRRRP
jgi:5-methyltetrahydrofolate--homocysteine methyltransferase